MLCGVISLWCLAVLLHSSLVIWHPHTLSGIVCYCKHSVYPNKHCSFLLEHWKNTIWYSLLLLFLVLFIMLVSGNSYHWSSCDLNMREQPLLIIDCQSIIYFSWGNLSLSNSQIKETVQFCENKAKYKFFPPLIIITFAKHKTNCKCCLKS